MAIARVFQSGNSQALRLPKAFRFSTTQVEILRRGDEVVIRQRRYSLRGAFEVLARLPPDAFAGLDADPAARS
jgi:antitoxin VapB